MTRDEVRIGLSDRQAVIATLYGEAASESLMGIIAVGCVIRNRVHADLGHDGKPDWWGEGFKNVCLKKWQFSCWWEDGAANTLRTYHLAEDLVKGRLANQTRLTQELSWVADGLMGDAVRDITHGADHYCTEALLRLKPPGWSRNRDPVARVGAHAFFRLRP